MKRNTSKTRRESTTMRDNQVHGIYNNILDELGPLRGVVAKSYIYDRIREQTRLSTRTISYILNHTREKVSLD